MKILYTLSLYIIKAILPLIALFNKKIRLFVSGRKIVWTTLNEKLDKNARYVWLHAASLGVTKYSLLSSRPQVMRCAKTAPMPI